MRLILSFIIIAAILTYVVIPMVPTFRRFYRRKVTHIKNVFKEVKEEDL
jgi:antibiotic biosynthesis monooxygenase (ABM) superfamily enzyme